MWWLIGVLVFLAVLWLLVSYVCYRMAFYAPPRKPLGDRVEIPEGEIYAPFRADMEKWARQAREMPHKAVEITSFDGLKLRGRYYEYAPGAPVEIMFNGYRGTSERDMPGGAQRCFKLGRNALLVDQRSCGKSEGNVITFGILEHRDCLSWVEFVIRRFGPDVRIILTGISMGASTVLIAGGTDLPKQVIGILADCGFTSAKAIIQKVIGQMGLPPKLCYPFVKWGAALYGRFDLEEVSALDAVKRCRVPVLFFHGDTDDYVPIEMSYENYNACTSRKQLVVVKNAGHGLSYLLDNPAYLTAAKDFFEL